MTIFLRIFVNIFVRIFVNIFVRTLKCIELSPWAVCKHHLERPTGWREWYANTAENIEIPHVQGSTHWLVVESLQG